MTTATWSSVQVVEALMLSVFATGAAMFGAPHGPLEAVSRPALRETETAAALDVVT
ncbi:hypothetical protein [Streptomyces sp. UNOC14_S4]|uniref:hypothetical protein n=1 Tax=Streptomyces sp. UNOC14_S4 TaxID=2872340 RepID=UPI001E436BFF|nr:hypothetical protein [Streptomyces sp. UNOC14_S4]MCC3772067.1 hypothetical protein [Streptomyces sp. UNOC14_S4]